MALSAYMEDIRNKHIFTRLYVRERAAARQVCCEWRDALDSPTAWPSMTLVIAQEFADVLSLAGRAQAAEWVGRVFGARPNYVALITWASPSVTPSEVKRLVAAGKDAEEKERLRQHALLDAYQRRRPDVAAVFRGPVPSELIQASHFCHPIAIELIPSLTDERARRILPSLVANGYYDAARMFIARGHSCEPVTSIAPGSSLADLRWVEEAIGIDQTYREDVILTDACLAGNREIIVWALGHRIMPRKAIFAVCEGGHLHLYRELVTPPKGNHTKQLYFLSACRGGNLALVKIMYTPSFAVREGMHVAAINGHIPVADWLRSKIGSTPDSGGLMFECAKKRSWSSAMWVYGNCSVSPVDLVASFEASCRQGTPEVIQWYSGIRHALPARLLDVAGRTDENACPAIQALLTHYTWSRSDICDAACRAYEKGLAEGAALFMAKLSDVSPEEYTRMLRNACRGGKVAAVRQLCHHVPGVNFTELFSEGVMLALAEHYGLLGEGVYYSDVATADSLDLAEYLLRVDQTNLH